MRTQTYQRLGERKQHQCERWKAEGWVQVNVRVATEKAKEVKDFTALIPEPTPASKPYPARAANSKREQTMNILDFNQWHNDDLKTAQRVLFDVRNNQKADSEGGDFSECPLWVVLFASQYFDFLLSNKPQKTVSPKLFRARSDNDRRIRRQIETQKLDTVQRIDWLSADKNPALAERFGSLSIVPEWVARAAVLSLEQHFHNLKSAQRQRPKDGQTIEQVDGVIDAQGSALQKVLAVSADLKGGQNG